MKKIGVLTILLLGLSIVLNACGDDSKQSSNSANNSQQTLKLELHNSDATLDENGEAKIDFTTTKGAKYSVLDKDYNNTKLQNRSYTSKTGNSTVTLYDAGHYTLEVRKGSLVKDKDFTIYESEGSSDDSTSSSEDTAYSIGDTVEFEGGQKITVTDIKSSSEGFNDSHPGQKAVDAYVTVENTTSQPLDFNVQEFSLYDSNDENAEFDSNTYQQDIPDTIAAGKKASLHIHFAAKTDAPYSISFGDAIWEQ